MKRKKVLFALILILSHTLALFTGAAVTLHFTGANPTAPSEPTVETLPSYVYDEADRVALAVSQLQTDTSFSFIAISDTHWRSDYSAGLRHAGEAAAMIRDSVSIDFAALLGDLTLGSAQTTLDGGQQQIIAINNYLEAAFSGIPNFRAVGNHDTLTYSYAQNGDYLENAEIYPLIGAYNTGAVNAEAPGGYCYRDLEAYRTRVILLNTSDMDGVTVSENTGFARISGAQAQWFAESLDLSGKAEPREWSILILSHIPLDYGSLLQSAGKILDAYLNGTATGFTWEGTQVRYDFSGKNSAEIIANIHGHNHCFLVDEMYVTDQHGKMYQSVIERICIPNACAPRNNERGINNGPDSNGIEFGETTAYPKTAGTAQDTAFNIVTVDLATKTIYCTNYGAGYDREISYWDELLHFESNFTNLVPTAQAFDSSEILDGVGYRNGCYLSTGSIRYGTDPDCVVVGAIPYTIPAEGLPPAIYIRGADLDNSAHVRFFILTDNKEKISIQASGEDICTYFTIETLGSQYYKLTPVADGHTSKLYTSATYLFTNAYITLSLKGTGNRLYVTFDEPIE